MAASVETLLDCYGYVSAICEETVDVELILQDGQKLKRVFSSELCSAAKVHYQNAFFRYTIVRYGAKITSDIKAEEPPRDYLGLVDLSQVDISVFDRLE